LKLLIVGLDGLEPELVERWNLALFKQRSYGRHYVGILRTLSTPLLWGTFLIGRNVEELGYDVKTMMIRKNLGLFPLPLKPLYWLRVKLLPRRLGLRRVLRKMGLVKEYSACIMPRRLIDMTFLEKLKSMGYSVHAIEVPGYNETINEKYRNMVPRYISSPFIVKLKTLMDILEELKDRVKEGLEAVERGFDIVFVYLPMPDVAHHFFSKGDAKSMRGLRRVYTRLEQLIEPLIRRAYGENYVVLIVSDHGFDFQTHDHSEYGFWSLNIDDFEFHTITDFCPKILELFERKESI